MSKRYAFVTYEDLRCVCVCVQIIHRNRFNSTFYSFLLFIGQSVAVVRLKLLTSHCKGRAWKWSTQKTNRCRITRCLQLIRSTQPRPKWRKPPFETSSYFCLFSLLFIFPRFVELARLMYTIFFSFWFHSVGWHRTRHLYQKMATTSPGNLILWQFLHMQTHSMCWCHVFLVRRLAICSRCNDSAGLQCERCGDFYCSIGCQTTDWSRHRQICFPMP